MNIKTTTLAILFFCTIGAVQAAKATQFSSAYTDLSKDCEAVEADKDLQEGQDASFRCKGPGAYRLFIFFSANENILTVEKGASKQALAFQITIPDFEKAKIEWRLADGRPFAMIARSGSPAARNLQTLEVRGLKGFEKLEFSLNLKQVNNANQLARKHADAAYLTKMKNPQVSL
jgi:hypothetical protein